MPAVARLKVHLQPRAKENRIVGWHGDALKIRLTAPPVDQKANEALVSFLAEAFGVARRDLRIVSGETSRTKQIQIEGITGESLARKLNELLKIGAGAL
jgi:uncharacterized protein (TIGR00251 family)